MKRGGFLKRKTGLKTKTPIQRKTKLRLVGVSETSDVKQEIQDIVRDIVILRDGGCVLRNTPFIPPCGGYRNDGQLILQADHLITRGNSATYADTRLIVCVCKAHHGWKSLGSNLNKEQYDVAVRRVLSPERVTLWERCEEDRWRPHRMGAYDWKLALVALKRDYQHLATQSQNEVVQ